MPNNIDITIRGYDKSKGAFNSVDKSVKKTGKGMAGFRAASKKAFTGMVNGAKLAAVAVIAIGTGLFKAAQRTIEFNKQIGQISTLADISLPKVKRQVKDLSAEFGLAKDELTKGLYDALSAGVPKDNALEFLRVAAKGAIAGASSTAEAVDLLTSALNSFKIPATEAEKVSDIMFATIKKGKTTMSELAASFATVGPLASASGVAIEEVMAAAATLTKQGTPTAQAMTQIRAAIIAMNKTLGDGWSQTMTLQEGMKAMSDQAGGSATKLKEMVGRVEGVMGILGTTGENAQMAADDLAAIGESAGETEAAFKKMQETMILDQARQAIDNMVDSIGEAAIAIFADDIEALTKALIRLEKDGDISRWASDMSMTLRTLGKVIKPVVEFSKGVGTTTSYLGSFFGELTEGERRKGEFYEAQARGEIGRDERYESDNIFSRTAAIREQQAREIALSKGVQLTPEAKLRAEALGVDGVKVTPADGVDISTTEMETQLETVNENLEEVAEVLIGNLTMSK